MSTIGFIGAGNMAEALIKGVIAAKVFEPGRILISDVRAERLAELAGEYKVICAKDNTDLASKADCIVLAVKPQSMDEVLSQIKGSLNKQQCLIISIAAGVTVATIAKALGDAAIIRVMPNTPALIGEGASALYANAEASKHVEMAMKIFSSLGKAVIVNDEKLIDAVTAVSGSGPAYFFLLIEEMIKAGTALGLDEQLAKELVLQTAKGAALLACEADKDGQTAAQLRKKVTSPGGTTEAALKVFAENQFSHIVEKAIQRAAERSSELSGK